MRWLPARYAAGTDPEACFAELGEQAASEITRLWAQMRAQDGKSTRRGLPGPFARLNAMRRQAEEIVLTELILLPPEPGPATG